MSAPRDQFPLSQHRTSLARYLRHVIFPGLSVAGRIINERLPEQYALDPVRPSLVLWACAASQGDLADALPVAAAFDLFDRFLLLHEELSNEAAPTVVRWGLGQSLNAGDAFYAVAFRSLASDVRNASYRLETARFVAEAVLEAIERNDDDLARSAALTGAALRAGAVVAGATPPVARIFETAGRLLVEDPIAAAAPLRDSLPPSDLAVFEEVVRYVARQAA